MLADSSNAGEDPRALDNGESSSNRAARARGTIPSPSATAELADAALSPPRREISLPRADLELSLIHI